jgi:hypothetical protein
LRADVHDVVNGQTGFKGSFRLAWINLQIAIEAEIANDGDAQ